MPHLPSPPLYRCCTADMAPEVLMGPTYDKRADIWSCGVMLFMMLFGINPFETPYPTAPEPLTVNGRRCGIRAQGWG